MWYYTFSAFVTLAWAVAFAFLFAAIYGDFDEDNGGDSQGGRRNDKRFIKGLLKAGVGKGAIVMAGNVAVACASMGVVEL